MPKDAFWFPHDSNARNDQFILEMRAKYGSQGYGWFWMLVEMMRDEGQYRLRVSNCNAFAMQLNCQPDAVSAFIDDCIQKYKLFASDGEWFWSDSLRRRMKHKDAVSRERQKVAKIRWEKAHANAMQLHSNSSANAMQNDAIRKEKKRGEEIREEPKNDSPVGESSGKAPKPKKPKAPEKTARQILDEWNTPYADVKAALTEFLEFRKTKEPMTGLAMTKAINKLMELSMGNGKIAHSIVDQSITANWTGLFPAKSGATQEARGTGYRRYGDAD
jgi:hypothetical protein